MNTENANGACSAASPCWANCREYAAIPFIYVAFCLLRIAAIVLGKSAPGTVGIFYNDPPNVKAHRAPSSESVEPNQPESGAPVQ